MEGVETPPDLTRLQHLLPDLFLLSMSKPVIGLLPSKPMVQRRAMVLSFTSLISTSGGSGGSERHHGHSQPSGAGDGLPAGGLWPLTLDRQLNDPSVLTKGVDGMAGEEAGILPDGGHDLIKTEQKGLGARWGVAGRSPWVQAKPGGRGLVEADHRVETCPTALTCRVEMTSSPTSLTETT